MIVIFGSARCLITAPEPAWGFVDGRPWCTKCNDGLLFVFVSAAEIDRATAANYQTPKAMRCKCFIETDRAPIPLEVD